jgi:putative membrane protein
VRWLNVERAMRRKKPLPVPLIVPIVSLVSAVAAGALALVIANL